MIPPLEDFLSSSLSILTLYLNPPGLPRCSNFVDHLILLPLSIATQQLPPSWPTQPACRAHLAPVALPPAQLCHLCPVPPTAYSPSTTPQSHPVCAITATITTPPPLPPATRNQPQAPQLPPPDPSSTDFTSLPRIELLRPHDLTVLPLPADVDPKAT